MTNLEKFGNNYLVNSSKIKVFPCGRRGVDKASNFDPESRAFTEKNLINLFNNKEKSSYIIAIVPSTNTTSTDYLLKLNLLGYYVEISLATDDFKSVLTEIPYINVHLESITMYDSAVSSSTDNTYATKMLGSILDGTKVLDYASSTNGSTTYYFTAIYFTAAVAGDPYLDLTQANSYLITDLLETGTGYGSINSKNINYYYVEGNIIKTKTISAGSATGAQSIAFGADSHSKGNNNVLLGVGLLDNVTTKDSNNNDVTSSNNNTVIIGQYNVVDPNAIFQIGTGADKNSRKTLLNLTRDKLVLDKINLNNINTNSPVITIGNIATISQAETKFSTDNLTTNNIKASPESFKYTVGLATGGLVYTTNASLNIKVNNVDDYYSFTKDEAKLVGTLVDFTAAKTTITSSTFDVQDITAKSIELSGIFTAKNNAITLNKATTIKAATTVESTLAATDIITSNKGIKVQKQNDTDYVFYVDDSGNMSLANDATIKGKLDLTKDLTVGGNTTISGTATITGAATTNGISNTGNITSSNKLTITEGGAEITGDTTITGTVTIDGAVSTKGISNTGTLTNSSKLTVSAGGAEITGDTAITGNLTVTGDINAGTGTVNTSSDIRLKTNIQDFVPKASILDLPIKTFEYINDETHQTHIGCIAQDLQKLYPELVTTLSDGYLAVNELKLVYLLLDEVKQLKREIAKLKED